MSIVIPDDILQASGLSEQELVQEIVLMLFERKRISIGKASNLLGAIALALELDAELLFIDEQLGREIAIKEGLKITGLLGILLEAKHQGLIESVKRIYEYLF